MADLGRPHSSPGPVLQVSGLNVYYGHSHALQGVDLALEFLVPRDENRSLGAVRVAARVDP